MATKKTEGKNSINKFEAEIEYTEYAKELYDAMYGVFMDEDADDQKMLKLVNAKNKPDDIMEKYIASVGELVGTQKTLKADAFRNIYFSALRTYYEWKKQRDFEEHQRYLEEMDKALPSDLELFKLADSIIYDVLNDESLDPTKLSFEDLKARADKLAKKNETGITPLTANMIKALAKNNKTTHVAKKDPKTNKYSFTPKDSDCSGN